MKNLSKVITICVVLLAAFLTSCDKEVETSPLTVDSFPKATITGYVYAPLDLKTFGDEPVANQDVIITMPYSDLGLGTGSLIQTVKTDAQGMFTLEVPADANGVTVTAKVVDFEYAQVQAYDDLQNPTVKKIFKDVDGLSFTVKSFDNNVQRVTLDEGTAMITPEYWYTMTGVVKSEIDETSVGYEFVPTGTPITFNCDGWSTTVNVETGGKFTVVVPGGEDIKGYTNFTVSGKNSGGEAVTWRFKGNNDFKANLSADTKILDVIIDNRSKVE